MLRFGDDRSWPAARTGHGFLAQSIASATAAPAISAPILWSISRTNIPEIEPVRNPLPAQGGQDPESLEDVRQRAPVAYRVQERAVTPADYAEVTERSRGRAARRGDLSLDRQLAHGISDRRSQRRRAGQRRIRSRHARHVERYRMAGHDLEVDGPQFVALEIDLHVCVAADHFRSDVERELFDVLSNRDLARRPARPVSSRQFHLRPTGLSQRDLRRGASGRRASSRWRCARSSAWACPTARRWRAAGSISAGWRSRAWTTIAISPSTAC